MEATPVRKTVKRKSVPVESASVSPTPSLKLYRRIAMSFVAITFLTLGVVMYLSFTRATIHVTPEQKDVSTNFIADVVTTPASDTDVAGKVVSNIFEQASSLPISNDSVKEVDAKAGGTVTIYNTTGTSQPLVATTRLLSPEGILFRIDEGVTVPANGSVQAIVHADVLGASGNIGPTQFTIPGLNASLQALIYAKSTEAFTGGVIGIRQVEQEDLDWAATQLQNEMLEAAKETLRLQAGGTWSGEAFFTEVMEKKSDTLPGTEASEVTISMKLRVVAVFYQQEDLLKIAQGKLYEQVPKGMELIGSADTVGVTVDKYDLDTQIANVSVTLGGTATLAPTSTLFDKQQFLGKSANQVKASLESSEAVKSGEIKFSPFWLRRMPTLKDHIKIVIE